MRDNIVTPKEMAQYDQLTINSGISSQELMERAGKGCFKIIEELVNKNSKILIVCGSGNNGGDGQVIARYLEQAGYNVTVMFTSSKESITTKFSEETYNNFKKISELGLPIIFADTIDSIKSTIPDYNVIIDCIFGTGMDHKRELSEYYKTLINTINNSNSEVISIDIPSGLNGFNGLYNDSIKADHTIAIQAIKTGEVLEDGPDMSGKISEIDIGINTDQQLSDNQIQMKFIDPSELRFPIERKKNSHKYHYGKILIIAGSRGMLGASALASKAALRTGAGLVTGFCSEQNYEALISLFPIEALLYPYNTILTERDLKNVKKDAILFGPGIGRNYDYAGLLETLLTQSIPLVVDADGIWMIKNHLDSLKEASTPTILTPHYGEFAQLIGITTDELKEDPVGYASKFAKEYNIVLILKAHNTMIASADGNIWFNTTGNPGLATPGSGDVLAGMVTTVLAQLKDPLEAAKCAVYYHGLAGDYYAKKYNQTTLLATDIIDSLKHVLKK